MPSSAVIGAVGELAASLHGAFTRRQAAAHAVSRHVLARLLAQGIVEEPVPGVLVFSGSPRTWHQRLHVATLAAADSGVAIVESAARLHRIDGFAASEVLRTTYRRGTKVGLPDLIVAQTLATYAAADLIVVDGIRCSGLARTVCDIARLGREALERAVDDFERRGASLGWLEHTAERLRRRGRAGIALVDAEIERRRRAGRVRGSWFEKLVEECLRSPHIPGLVRQFVVEDDLGGFVGQVDLAVPAVRLAIECHSRRWHTGMRPEAVDQRRDNRMGELGWDVRYLGWADGTKTLRQTCEFIERIVNPGGPPISESTSESLPEGSASHGATLGLQSPRDRS